MKNYLLFFFLSTSQALALGFKNGNNLEAYPLRGSLTLTCSEGQRTETRTIACAAEILNPVEMDYFVGPQIAGADKLLLQATGEDGESSTLRQERYLGDKGQSQRRVNLWLTTWSLRPLLNYGKNVVSYSIHKDKQVLEQATFLATVTKMPERRCERNGNYVSNSLQDCANAESFCGRYFRAENYCLGQ